ncbi:MAG: methyltransferase domain-containing protein [Spirochaetales bacterium]|nr:methyltransferase domain-containing protein [Spirochaetales bacterium]
MRGHGGVAAYYDHNTSRFLRKPKDRERGAIHRMLYAPGVRSRADALEYVNSLVLNQILNRRPQRVLDLGCGVGGTIRYLQRFYAADYSGITISETQVKIGGEFGTRLEHADFLDPGWYSRQEPFQCIFAIESIQHNPDHQRLLENLRMITETGACFLVIDDFLRPGAASTPSAMRGPAGRRTSTGSERLLERFRKNWHAAGIASVRDFAAVCGDGGFELVEETDLSGYMRSAPVLNRMLFLLSSLLQLHPSPPPWMENIIGGNALMLLQERGISGYYMLLFRRR